MDIRDLMAMQDPGIPNELKKASTEEVVKRFLFGALELAQKAYHDLQVLYGGLMQVGFIGSDLDLEKEKELLLNAGADVQKVMDGLILRYQEVEPQVDSIQPEDQSPVGTYH